MDFNEKMRHSLEKQHRADMLRMDKQWERYLKHLDKPDSKQKMGGIFPMMLNPNNKPIPVATELNLRESMENLFIDHSSMSVGFMPIPQFSCNEHLFRATHKTDENSVLIWECVNCKMKVSSM